MDLYLDLLKGVISTVSGEWDGEKEEDVTINFMYVEGENGETYEADWPESMRHWQKHPFPYEWANEEDEILFLPTVLPNGIAVWTTDIDTFPEKRLYLKTAIVEEEVCSLGQCISGGLILGPEQALHPTPTFGKIWLRKSPTEVKVGEEVAYFPGDNNLVRLWMRLPAVEYAIQCREAVRKAG